MSEDIEVVYEQWCDFKASSEYHLMLVCHGFKPLFCGVEIATLEAYGKRKGQRMTVEELARQIHARIARTRAERDVSNVSRIDRQSILIDDIEELCKKQLPEEKAE